jgi:hypothetical protein
MGSWIRDSNFMLFVVNVLIKGEIRVSLVCRFSFLLLALQFFLLLDGLFELLFGFWFSSCASWGLGFEIQTLCFLLSMYSSRGRLRNQVVSTFL